jgi:hypothetical protein
VWYTINMIVEGDFVMCPEGYEDKPLVGQVEYVMTDGMFGIPGSEYAIEASIEEPAVLVRHFEEEDGVWEAEMILSGHKASHLVKIESLKVERDVVSEEFSSTDSETQMAMFDAQIGKADDSMMPTETYQGNKQAPCWDGYVQRGMKPGADGNPVPNCIPVTKTESIFFSAKDYSKDTRITSLFKE